MLVALKRSWIGLLFLHVCGFVGGAWASDADLFLRIDTPAHTISCSCTACGGASSDAVSGGFDLDPTGSLPASAVTVSPSNGAFDIILNPNATLSGNAPALAAFERAAATWESFISDPIDVNLNVGLESLSAGVLASAGSVVLSSGYDSFRSLMILDAAAETDDGIVASLPTLAQSNFSLPTGFLQSNSLSANKAALKALGATGLDAQFGATDATINFSTNFGFDFDNSDGVGAGLIDFETVALHEIGHALGFTSAVDSVDFAARPENAIPGLPNTNPPTDENPAVVTPRLLDLFRFAAGTEPGDETAFTNAARSLEPGVEAVFTDLELEGAMSTGAFTGDGRQASHWKDNNLSGTLLGIMDPTLEFQQVVGLNPLDLRTLDLIGYDIQFIPEPSGPVLMLSGLIWLGFRRRR